MPAGGMTEKGAAAGLDRGLVRRLQAALTAGYEELFSVLLDPSPEVLRTTLKNRSLSEDHLLALLKRRDLPEDLLKAVHQKEGTEGSRRLLFALAKNPATPTPVVLSILPHLFLFELLDLCLLPGTTPDLRVAAERQIVKRLPTTPLGNKLTLARRGTPTLVGELLREGEPQIVAVCLDSSRLREIDLLQFLNGPRADAETISAIARHPRWKDRPNLQIAILKNPKTPPVWFTLFLPRLKTPDLQGILGSKRLAPPQKILAEQELKKRGRG